MEAQNQTPRASLLDPEFTPAAPTGRKLFVLGVDGAAEPAGHCALCGQPVAQRAKIDAPDFGLVHALCWNGALLATVRS